MCCVHSCPVTSCSWAVAARTIIVAPRLTSCRMFVCPTVGSRLYGCDVWFCVAVLRFGSGLCGLGGGTGGVGGPSVVVGFARGGVGSSARPPSGVRVSRPMSHLSAPGVVRSLRDSLVRYSSSLTILPEAMMPSSQVLRQL